jgi:hypothetical protein
MLRQALVVRQQLEGEHACHQAWAVLALLDHEFHEIRREASQARGAGVLGETDIDPNAAKLQLQAQISSA